VEPFKIDSESEDGYPLLDRTKLYVSTGARHLVVFRCQIELDTPKDYVHNRFYIVETVQTC